MNEARKIAKADGKDLALRSGTTLPAICIKSNAPVDASNLRREKLSWTPATSGKGIIKVARYFAGRQHCELAYAIAPGKMLIYRLGFVAKLLGVVVGFLLLVFGAITMGKTLQSILMASGLVLIIASMAMLPFGNRPLRIVRQQGDVFWIRGFSKTYLDRFR